MLFRTNAGFPAYKIIFGIPTFARTWKITNLLTSTTAPLKAEGPGEGGPIMKIPGLLTYAELCVLMQTQIQENKLEKCIDSTNLIYGEVTIAPLMRNNNINLYRSVFIPTTK